MIEAKNDLPDLIPAMIQAGRMAWIAGDQTWLIRQHEMTQLCYNECKCDRHQCGGCRALLRAMGEIEKFIPPSDDSGVIERAEVEARITWNRAANLLASQRARIVKRADDLRDERAKESQEHERGQ